MLRVDGGVYSMGDKEKRTAHTVYVDDFYISQNEVTIADFKAFVDRTGYQTEAERDGSAKTYVYVDETTRGWQDTPGAHWRKPGYDVIDTHPVTCVSWNDAVAYCSWLAKETGVAYRLPTEAEWEFAAQSRRGGSAYAWGDREPDGTQGNLADSRTPYPWAVRTIDDGHAFVAPVGSYPVNVFGLHDMSGNVWEWCQDYHAPYTLNVQKNPTGPETGEARVMRGGSWMNEPKALQTRFRNYDDPSAHYNNLGFRVSHSAE